MTIQWGSWEYSGGNGMRAGIQIESQTTPTNGSTTFVVTFSCWTQNQASYSDSQTFDITSNKTLSDSSIAYTNSQTTTATKRGSNQTSTHTYTTYGTSPGSLTINGTVNGTYNGVTPNVAVAVTIPARPWANPAATTVATVSRVSDTQASVSWTNHDTTSAKYGNIKLYRKTDAGAYSLRATLGVVTSYSDTGIVANHKYRYRPNVLGSNGAEVTGDESGDIWTTPGTPTTLSATKLAGGNIRLAWINNVNYTEYTVRIEESQDGGAYSEIANVASGTTQWDHVAPSVGVTHRYRVRARTSSGTTLDSSYSNLSELITLLSTANPPTDLSPSGSTFDATESILLSWTHSPTDGTPQTSYRIQYEVDGGSTVTVGPTTSATSSYTLPASTVANGATITWRVATAGENTTLSANSSTATFYTQDRPTSTISSPTGGTVGLSQLTVAWTYFQAQSSVQSAWHAYLWLKGAELDYSDATLIGEQAGSGATAEFTFPATLLDGETYKVQVFVTSAAGLDSSASGTDAEEFVVAYLPPADVTLSATYEADYGRMAVMAIGADPEFGVTEAISAIDLQRQIDGGEWVTWATGIVLSSTPLTAVLVDTAPTIKGDNNYRAIIRSAIPSSKLSTEFSVTTNEPRWGFLSVGNGFSDVARMRARLAGRASIDRSKSQYHFAGRSDPVELSGEETRKLLAMQATLYPPSKGGQSTEPGELERMAETDGIVLWRDYTGRRIFASLSGFNIDYNTDSVLYPASFNLLKVDYDENVG